MASCLCRIPLTIRLHGAPDEERLAQLAGEVAISVADVLARADRAIALRRGGAGWHKVYRRPRIRLQGREIDPALGERLEQDLRAAVVRALAPALGGHSPGDATAGDAEVFWDALRSQLRVSASGGDGGSPAARDEAIGLLIDGIDQVPAQLVIHDALVHESPSLRVAMMEGLGRVRARADIAWRLLLRGLVRHGDTLGLAQFEHWLDRDPAALLTFLSRTLEANVEPDRSRAAQVVLHCLEGQFLAARAQRRPSFDRLRRLAHAHHLFGSGPLGHEALRARVRAQQAVLHALAGPGEATELASLDAAALETQDARQVLALVGLAVAAERLEGARQDGDPLRALTTSAGATPGLLQAGHCRVWRYDPGRPPPGLAALVATCRRLCPDGTHFSDGILLVRGRPGNQLQLLVAPGPVHAVN